MNEIAARDAATTPSAQADITGILTEYLDSTGLTKRLTPSEKAMFINMAKAYGLNPFKREIYCTPYGQGEHRQCSIVTGYEVYLKRAERLGKLDGWECATDGKVHDGTLTATVTIYRKDWSHPFRHTVYFREVFQTKKDGQMNSFWKKQPYFMAKKVAIAQGFRLCFPDEFCGMPYTSDEMGIEPAPEALPGEDGDIAEPGSMQEPEAMDNGGAQADSEGAGCEEEAIRLEELLSQHRFDLKGEPYRIASECLGRQDATAEELSAMYRRCAAYLRNKGVRI